VADPVAELLVRTGQALGASAGGDTALVRDLTAALAAAPADAGSPRAALHNALGLAETLTGQGRGPTTAPLAERAAGHFQRAVGCDAHHVLAAVNRVETLAGIGQRELAAEGARRILARLERQPLLDPAMWGSGHFPPGFDPFRVAWERAARGHAGDPGAETLAKQQLLRGRLHQLLAELTGELHHHYEAVVACPALPTPRAALGRALLHTGRPAAAVCHLRQAVTANPFDAETARTLYQVLGVLEDADGLRRLARSRRLLGQAAPQLPVEDWFVQAPPVGDELAAILVLCCNQRDDTRLCLESVLQHTRSPYELILVDNGSSDATPAYLAEIAARQGPQCVPVIRNETNQGYPRGCNRALVAARGRYLVFLNNDTGVTAGWLEGLIGWSLHDWPQVGLVGAVTNASRPPQEMAVPSRRLADLAAFAEGRRRELRGKAQAVERLAGFCLLARREVFERTGGIDEGYGLGFFDDDDLCVRALNAGFRLLLALDVFVHHFGSRTFTALGIDGPQLLRQNFERFHAKWGAAHSSGYRFPPASRSTVETEPPTAVVSHTSLSSPRVSLCLIVRNEEANLADCLRSAADLVQEIVVVDTGSTDRTKEIAQEFGARVFEFPWCDSFAAARKESLRHATGDWIFWLDADDRLDEENRAKLRGLFAGLPAANAADVMTCLCLPDPVARTATEVTHVRLFRNHPQIRWQYRVHEQILPAVRQTQGEVHWTDFVVRHVGYQDPALRRRKLDRDLRLLRLDQAEHADDPFILFNLGSVTQELGQPAEALPLLLRSLEHSHPSDSIVRKLYALIAGCHGARGALPPALQACQEGRRHYPDDTELLFLEAQLRRDQGDLEGASGCLLRLLAVRPAAYFASIDTGLRGYKARHDLAVVYCQQGRPAEASEQWPLALTERPDFVPSWLGLAELDLKAGDWTDLETVAQRLEKQDQALEAAVLRARGCWPGGSS
jgi:glycosyltransferase involved in cell wall biosynthesis